jgi:hypothetical protein
VLFFSFDAFKPHSASFRDFKVRAAAFGAFDEGVRNFGDEVYGFCRVFVEFLFSKEPSVAADATFEFSFGLSYVEFGVIEVCWFKLGESEAEDVSLYLLHFPDFHVNFRDFFQAFFLDDLCCRGDYCFG